ncbi:MAG: SCO family protein [Gemmatimonadota bacterium]|nr:SCO family protein [Gemmatimonadota bacterium]MDH3369356.1 SCO family protein [Gemmatimonadota bacterium]MDH3479725.1 SCO family protein [Gemmatimonadota bacterium]MDH3569093.1 SCO family protein [Gemmatimonadota bacterium]MDH5550606.1 SCO family protein [Gemmatimonadota bacterium]
MTRREWGPLGALALIIAVTVAWWALALWPLPTEAPEWLYRTRNVCFGVAGNGLPDASGWMLLIAEPITMVAILAFLFGEGLRRGFRLLARARVGQTVLVGAILGVAVGLGAVAARVHAATSSTEEWFAVTADMLARLDDPAPSLGLLDQVGNRVTLEQFRGRPLLVGFAFAHCTTVCPRVVQDVQRARRRLGDGGIGALIVTLDPVRDTPSRLPGMAQQWNLDPGTLVASGPINDVERVLDEWGVPRERDPLTGDVVHPALVLVIDAEGVIRYRTPGGPDLLVDLVAKL